MNDAPFDVSEEVVLGDLSDVKQEDLLPAAKEVLFEVVKAFTRSIGVEAKETISPENPCTLRFLKVELRIVEGIPVGSENGTASMKYQGKHIFPEIVIWANPELKVSDWYKSRKHLLDIKQFLVALGFDAKAFPPINDEFCESLKGMKLKGNIRKEFIQAKNEEGKWVNTEDEKNRYDRWKVAA